MSAIRRLAGLSRTLRLVRVGPQGHFSMRAVVGQKRTWIIHLSAAHGTGATPDVEIRTGLPSTQDADFARIFGGPVLALCMGLWTGRNPDCASRQILTSPVNSLVDHLADGRQRPFPQGDILSDIGDR